MSKRQAKNQAFGVRQRRQRIVARIVRANRSTAGFLGAVTSFTIRPVGGPAIVMGAGALFRVTAADDAYAKAGTSP